MTLRLRRGTDIERTSIVPAEGELVYTTDTKEIYVGDGSTLGGLRVTGSVTNSPATLTQNLNLNNFTINGTGTININGNITGQDVIANNNILAGGTIQGTQFIGDGSLLTGVSSSGIVEGSNYRINIVANDSTVMLDTVSQNIIGNFFGDASNVTGITLNQLDDVSAITPPDGSVLTWDAGLSQWTFGLTSGAIVEGSNYRFNIIGDDSTVLINTATNTIQGTFFGDGANISNITLTQLADVNVISPPDGSVLVYDAGLSEWTFGEGGGAGIIEGQFYKIGIAGDDSTILVDNVNSRLTGDLFYNVNGTISANGDISIVTSSGRVAINGHEFFGGTSILQPNFDGGAEIGSPFARYLSGHFIDVYALRLNGDGSGITNIPPSALDPNQIYEISIQGDILGPDSTPAYNFGANLFKGDFEGAFIGSLFGDVQGDVIGSVFGDDSTLLVDGTSSTIAGQFVGNINTDGSVEIYRTTSGNININLRRGTTENPLAPNNFDRSGISINGYNPGTLTYETIALFNGYYQTGGAGYLALSPADNTGTFFTTALEIDGLANDILLTAATIRAVGGFRVGSYSNATRDSELGSDSSTIDGTIIYNTSIQRVEFFQAGSWVPLPNAGTSAGQVLTWDGTKWEGTAPATGGSVVSADQLDGFDGPYYLDWANFTNTPTTIAGYGIVDAFDGDFGSLSNTPTTLSGYGITDAINTSAISAFGLTLVDDADAATARATLGLGTAATTNSGDYATAAQGAKADTAIQPGDVLIGDLVGSVFADDSTVLVDAVNGNIPKANIEDHANWDTAYGWGNHASAGYLTSSSLGTFTFTGSVIDTSDSSSITVTPDIIFSSDVTVQNDLIVTNKIIAETIEVQNIITNASGTPEIASDTDIILSAGTRVEVASSPFKLASFTTAERDALSAQNGDMIYNTDANKFQGYAGGVWVNLH